MKKNSSNNQTLNDPAWAWTQYRPDNDNPWDLLKAGHLFRRAAFGANWGEIKKALKSTPQKTIETLIHPTDDVTSFNNTYEAYEKRSSGSESTENLCAWWLRRIINTPHPLLENLTLFWHNSFAISNLKVKNANLMYQHIKSIRANALGDFRSLFQSIYHEPAMFVWHDATKNRKVIPNEYFAEEMLKSIGSTSHTKRDVKDIARAFTGWFVLNNRIRILSREHDADSKNIFGEKGNWNSKEAVRIILKQPCAASHIIRELYKWFISDTEEPDDLLIEPLVKSFAKDYNIAETVKKILGSNLFFSSKAYRQRIKSPVEFATGIIKGLEGNISTLQLGKDLAELGQDLYSPPTGSGWPCGKNWINSSTLIRRSNLVFALLNNDKIYGRTLKPSEVSKTYNISSEASMQHFFVDLFLQGDVQTNTLKKLQENIYTKDPRKNLNLFIHSLLMLPEYQLT